MPRPIPLGLLVGCLVGMAGPSMAQEPASLGVEPDVPEKAGKELRALRVEGTPPLMDGRLDDEAWQRAQAIDDFVQEEPDNMEAPTEHTVVQIAYDDRFLYVAVRCDFRAISQIRTGLGRRDSLPPSDTVSVGFDPRHDHLTAYVFRVNASGVQGDLTFFDDTSSNNDYDAVWEAATQVTPLGWQAEMRIPFSQMRFSVARDGPATWGLQVRRDVQYRGEVATWVPKPRGQTGQVSRFGHLTFGDRLAPPRRMELLPFTLSRFAATSGAQTTRNVQGGLDVRLGLGTAATLSATVNPDFGQVEADPAVLNLSVFETFFPERRPFFLEDSRTFVLPYFQVPGFYSRRIGRAPGRFALETGDRLVSQPDTTTILGATKLTGKASGWTFGGLAALTSREYATVDVTKSAPDGADVVSRTERLIEPMTTYSVGRVQRDILHGSSNVGAILTSVVREGDDDAFTGGGDFNLRWSRNRYGWSGYWVGTRTPIAGVVRGGFGGVTNFGYSGKYIDIDAHYDHIGSTFRNADLGFLSSRVNKNEINGGLRFNRPDPWHVFRNLGAFVTTTERWNNQGLVFARFVGAGGIVNFRNFWNVYFNTFHNFEALDDLDTRGGPPILRPSNWNMNSGVATDSRRRWRAEMHLSGGRDEGGGWFVFVGPNLRLQPSSRLQTSLSASYNAAVDAAQWIQNSDADHDGIEDHVYGRLRRDVLNIVGRATYAFNRDMTLEAFLQPFVAVGDYTSVGKLARPASFAFEPVVLEESPDFNRKSLRGTMVLRWEYLRGSTLFLVWNLSTSDASGAGVFSPVRDLGRAFGADGTSVLAIKINYWLTP